MFPLFVVNLCHFEFCLTFSWLYNHWTLNYKRSHRRQGFPVRETCTYLVYADIKPFPLALVCIQVNDAHLGKPKKAKINGFFFVLAADQK